MKKGIEVTIANLSTIFGHVRNSLKKSSRVRVQHSYASTIKSALRTIELHNSPSGKVTERRDIAISYESFYSSETIFERCYWRDGEPFISIGGPSGPRTIIDIGDRVRITAQGVFVAKKNPGYGPRHKRKPIVVIRPA